MTPQEHKDRLIQLFKIDGPPYMLQYRRMGRGRKVWMEDIPILSQMIKEGSVKEVEKTRTTILYKYYPTQP